MEEQQEDLKQQVGAQGSEVSDVGSNKVCWKQLKADSIVYMARVLNSTWRPLHGSMSCTLTNKICEPQELILHKWLLLGSIHLSANTCRKWTYHDANSWKQSNDEIKGSRFWQKVSDTQFLFTEKVSQNHIAGVLVTACAPTHLQGCSHEIWSNQFER